MDLTPLTLFPRTNETLYDQHRDTAFRTAFVIWRICRVCAIASSSSRIFSSRTRPSFSMPMASRSTHKVDLTVWRTAQTG